MERDRRSALLLAVIGAVAAVALATTAALLVTELADHAVALATSPTTALFTTGLLVTFASALLAQARHANRPQVQRIEARHGRLTMANGLILFPRRPWSTDQSGRVVVGGAGCDWRSRRQLGHVAVRSSWPFGRRLLSYQPYDECVWVAEVLNAALGHGPLADR